MRKVLVSEFLTLDGVMQAPGGSDEVREGGFEHGGWQMPYFDEMAGKAVSDTMAVTGGSCWDEGTYEHSPPTGPRPPRMVSSPT